MNAMRLMPTTFHEFPRQRPVTPLLDRASTPDGLRRLGENELEGLANRGYTDGFYERHHTHEYQNYMTGHSQAKRSQYVGDVLTVGADGRARVEVKNRFERGDRLEVIQPGGNHEIIVGDMLGCTVG